MGKILDKFLGVIGVEVEEDESAEGPESQWREPEKERKPKKANLLSLPAQRPVTMMLLRAKAYEEVESIAQHLKERRSVVVNFEGVEKETAQRMVDFLSGAVFALDGSVQKVSAGIFFFATAHVDVVDQINECEREKALFKNFSWTKK